MNRLDRWLVSVFERTYLLLLDLFGLQIYVFRSVMAYFFVIYHAVSNCVNHSIAFDWICPNIVAGAMYFNGYPPQRMALDNMLQEHGYLKSLNELALLAEQHCVKFRMCSLIGLVFAFFDPALMSYFLVSYALCIRVREPKKRFETRSTFGFNPA